MTRNACWIEIEVRSPITSEPRHETTSVIRGGMCYRGDRGRAHARGRGLIRLGHRNIKPQHDNEAKDQGGAENEEGDDDEDDDNDEDPEQTQVPENEPSEEQDLDELTQLDPEPDPEPERRLRPNAKDENGHHDVDKHASTNHTQVEDPFETQEHHGDKNQDHNNHKDQLLRTPEPQDYKSAESPELTTPDHNSSSIDSVYADILKAKSETGVTTMTSMEIQISPAQSNDKRKVRCFHRYHCCLMWWLCDHDHRCPTSWQCLSLLVSVSWLSL